MITAFLLAILFAAVTLCGGYSAHDRRRPIRRRGGLSPMRSPSRRRAVVYGAQSTASQVRPSRPHPRADRQRPCGGGRQGWRDGVQYVARM